MHTKYIIFLVLLNAAILAVAETSRANDQTASPVMSEPNQYLSPTVANRQGFRPDGFYLDWPWGTEGLSGNWGGTRGWLQNHGIRISAQYTSISMVNLRGGLDQGYYGGAPLQLTFTADLERLAGIPGATFFVDWEYFSWYNRRYQPTGSRDPTGSYVGDNTNLIDGDASVLNQLAQVYWNQALLDDRLNLQFGKMDVNASFAAVAAAGAFQNSIAMFTSTLNPFMATYPNETTGLQVIAAPTENFQTKIGWFDGTTAALNPRTGQTGPATGGRGPSSFFNNDGHWFLIAEANHGWEIDPTRPGTAGAGMWLQTGTSATDGTSTTGVRDVPGFYLQATQTLWSETPWLAERGGGVRLFGQFGWSDADKNPVHWSMMAGISATGVIPTRPADAIGLLGAHSRFSDDPEVFRSRTRAGLPGPSGGTESSIEAFYLLQILPWLYIQPGLQWIATPGAGDPAPLDNAMQAYLLVAIEL
ncbi:MAG: carbohydrate porin [Candidatus Binatia bacterium]|nr:carbohydrate porin [Candidatus Binatia bacterium]MDG2009690.1 carbohydrate porin [Candidatus Binatia bacterium]